MRTEGGVSVTAKTLAPDPATNRDTALGPTPEQSNYIPAHPQAPDLTSSERGATRPCMRFFHASIARARRQEIRRDLRCLDPFDLASRPDPNWQAAGAPFSLDDARSWPLPRVRFSTHSACGPMAVGRSRSRVNHRTPARTASPSAPRYRLRAGSTAPLRLGARDHARRDRDRLGADDLAAPLLRAGGSASAPYRRAGLAAIGGGRDEAAAVRSPSAAASSAQEAA